jgi:peptidoglycan/xylan/chitin deacetylase (PgdA/CDA1 family)/glycosyltransferase involved in cell wall biosynthesis
MDDVEDSWTEFANLTLMDIFISKSQSLSPGLIMNRIGANPKLISKIREGIQRGQFELALHGWDHVEYTNLSEQEQHDSLKKANEKMQQLFGQKSNIFIPPLNFFNDSTLNAMHKLQIRIISSGVDNDKNIFYTTGPGSSYRGIYQRIYHFPQTASFEIFGGSNQQLSQVSVNRTLSDVDFSIKKYGYAVITIHVRGLSVDEQQIDNLKYVIDSILSKNIKIVSFSKLLEISLGKQELLLASQDSSDLNLYHTQLKMVIRRVQNSKGAMIFFPSTGWYTQGTHIQRNHQLAREFASQGYVSIFNSNNEPLTVGGFNEVKRNLFVFQGPDYLLHQIPDPVLWIYAINDIEEKNAYLTTARTIYDFVDDLDIFPLHITEDRLYSSFSNNVRRNHLRALREATIVACVSRRLYNEAICMHPESTIYLPNAVQYSDFAGEAAARLPEDPEIAKFVEYEGQRQQQRKPIIGYYGAIGKWFDNDLLDSVARLRLDWNFVLIGMKGWGHLGQTISASSNVFCIGARDYYSLAGYLRIFDVAMIPFRIINIILSSSQVKLYEYFAAGKPVISTPIPECEAFPEVHIVRDAQEFSRALDIARKQSWDFTFRNHLRSLARENSWSERVRTVTKELKNNINKQQTTNNKQQTTNNKQQTQLNEKNPI